MLSPVDHQHAQHDVTIAALFSTFALEHTNFNKTGYPHYAACVTLELLRSRAGGDFSVRVLYWPEVKEFEEITSSISGCEQGSCSLEQFRARSEPYRVPADLAKVGGVGSAQLSVLRRASRPAGAERRAGQVQLLAAEPVLNYAHLYDTRKYSVSKCCTRDAHFDVYPTLTQSSSIWECLTGSSRLTYIVHFQSVLALLPVEVVEAFDYLVLHVLVDASADRRELRTG